MKLRELQDSVKSAFERAVDYSSNIAYQPGRALKKFPKHAKLVDVDYISFQQRFLARSHPHVSVKFNGYSRKDVPVELLPRLILGSSYENKVRKADTGLMNHTLVVGSAKPFIHSPSGRRYVGITSSHNELFVVRQIEIARVLFLHNPHLARTAFRPDGLNGMARVSNAKDKTVITMHKMSDYPVSNLKSSAVCMHLSWLFLDAAARRSFGSIFNRIQGADNQNETFEFEVPPLTGWEIMGKARSERRGDGAPIELTEITKFHNPNFYLSKPVEIIHPHHKETTLGQDTGERSARSKRPDPDPEMDLSMRPSKRKGVEKFDETGFAFTFPKSAPVSVQANANPNPNHTKSGPESGENTEPEKEYSSAGHGDVGGSAKELDVGINRSENDVGAVPQLEGVEPNERFPLFEQVINQLASTDRFNLKEIKCVKLPNPDTGSRVTRRTKNQKPLQCYVAVISSMDEDLAIIEIDVENLLVKKAISTLIVGFSDNQNANHGILEILRSCAAAGVRWDMDSIRKNVGHADKCYHPRREKKSGTHSRKLTPDEYQERWVARLRGRLNLI